MPMVKITHTSNTVEGQIFVPAVNFLIMIGTIGLSELTFAMRCLRSLLTLAIISGWVRNKCGSHQRLRLCRIWCFDSNHLHSSGCDRSLEAPSSHCRRSVFHWVWLRRCPLLRSIPQESSSRFVCFPSNFLENSLLECKSDWTQTQARGSPLAWQSCFGSCLGSGAGRKISKQTSTRLIDIGSARCYPSSPIRWRATSSETTGPQLPYFLTTNCRERTPISNSLTEMLKSRDFQCSRCFIILVVERSMEFPILSLRF